MPHILVDRDVDEIPTKWSQMTSTSTTMATTTSTGLGTSAGSLASSTTTASAANMPNSSAIKIDQEHLASIAASTIATLNALNHPFVRLQSDLENKISGIIGKLEELRENEACLADILLGEKERQRRQERSRSSSAQKRHNMNDNNDVDSCFYDRSDASSGADDLNENTSGDRVRKRSASKNIHDEKETRLKHLERLQETQVDR